MHYNECILYLIQYASVLHSVHCCASDPIPHACIQEAVRTVFVPPKLLGLLQTRELPKCQASASLQGQISGQTFIFVHFLALSWLAACRVRLSADSVQRQLIMLLM